MENTHLQLAIREMQQQIGSYRFWAGLLCVVYVITVAAPFDTGEQFNSIQRFFYWLGIAVSTYFLAGFILVAACSYLKAKSKSELTSRVIASLLAGMAVALLVFFINTIVLGVDDLSWEIFVFLGVNCVLISLAIAAIFFVVNDSVQQQGSEVVDLESPASDLPALPFHQRLPEKLGTDLISLQAQDHYVEATTTQGSELILIRLSDAIRELGEVSGIQVHRSWWVTHKHVVEQKRIKNKLHLILSDGSAVPVSRTYSADVKAALAVKAI